MLRRPQLNVPAWLLNTALGLLALAVLAGAASVLRSSGGPGATSASQTSVTTPSTAPSPATTRVRAVVFGDSLVAGASTGAGNPTFVEVASRLLGWTTSSFGYPGSGFTTAGRFAGGRDYLARIEQLKGYDIDVLVIEGGLNDTAADAATLRAKAAAVLARAHQLLPTTTVVLMGPWSPSGTPTRPAALADQTLKTLANDSGVAYVDPIGEQWLSGTPGKSGNAAQYISGDGLYPNSKGHAYFGQRLAQDLTRLLPARLLPAS